MPRTRNLTDEVQVSFAACTLDIQPKATALYTQQKLQTWCVNNNWFVNTWSTHYRTPLSMGFISFASQLGRWSLYHSQVIPVTQRIQGGVHVHTHTAKQARINHKHKLHACTHTQTKHTCHPSMSSSLATAAPSGGPWLACCCVPIAKVSRVGGPFITSRRPSGCNGIGWLLAVCQENDYQTMFRKRIKQACFCKLYVWMRLFAQLSSSPALERDIH